MTQQQKFCANFARMDLKISKMTWVHERNKFKIFCFFFMKKWHSSRKIAYCENFWTCFKMALLRGWHFSGWHKARPYCIPKYYQNDQIFLLGIRIIHKMLISNVTRVVTEVQTGVKDEMLCRFSKTPIFSRDWQNGRHLRCCNTSTSWTPNHFQNLLRETIRRKS